MKEILKDKLSLAVMCLMCVMLTWRFGSGLEGTEFSGGHVTGPLLDMYDLGIILFALGCMLTFFCTRIAGVITLSACLFCLPLFLYFTAPGPFRWIMRGKYSVPETANFVWSTLGIVGLSSLMITGLIAARALASGSVKRSR